MSTHEEFFKELRAAREAKGASLDDISRATLIDRKYLEAIEGGEVHILPTAYVRAFIREYAAAIGMDPAEVMRTYDEASHPPAATTTPATEPPPAPLAAPPQDETPPAPKAQRTPWWENRVLLTAIIAVAVVCVIAFILDLSKTKTPRNAHEIPFSTAVRENEQRLLPADSTRPAGQAGHSTPADSLVLYAASLDSVWMELSIDGTPPIDYLFPPNVRRQWKAREKFTVTLGNGGGMVFRLNSLEIGTIGKPGSVVRNYELSRKTLASPRTSGATP